MSQEQAVKGANSKFKSYLIEKLLNESSNQASTGTSAQINKLKCTEDKEDLASETGTYTIEDEQTQELIAPKSNNTNLDIVSARAAIDETFGIKRPEVVVEADKQEAKTENSKALKRHTQTIRLRNKTYSLTKDLLDLNCKEPQLDSTLIEQPCLSSTSSASSSSHSMNDLNPSNKIKKTTTYEVIAESKSDNAQSARTVATDVLLGDTENLMEVLRKRRMDKKAELKSKLNENLSSSSASSSSTNLSNDKNALVPLSTRATVNFDADEDDTINNQSLNKKVGLSGLSFEFNLTNNNNNNNICEVNPVMLKTKNLTPRSTTNSSVLTITKGYEMRKTRKDDLVNSSLSSTNETVLNTPKSAISLGAKIQAKAKENQSSSSVTPKSRRSSDSGPPAPQTNRTLYLRQQTAKAKRDSMERQSVETSPRPTNGILKKPTTTVGVKAKTPTPGRLSSSRNTSPNALMTSSLNLPSGGSLPTSLQHDSFQRRKNYDPLKSVQMAKQKTSLTKCKESKVDNKRGDSSEKLNGMEQNQFSLDFDSMSDSSSYNSLPYQQVDSKQAKSVYQYENPKPLLTRSYSVRENPSKSVLSGKKSEPIRKHPSLEPIEPKHHQPVSFAHSFDDTYEKILQSTLQRLCIRLIQMSTGVLDKIGDNRANICDSLQILSTNNELERMQLLTKLVHSMQLVHDHMQYIDLAMFNQKSDDNYIKELTRIRQEVDMLKQSAVLNTSPAVTSRLFSAEK